MTDISVTNINDAEMTKTGRGFTKVLYRGNEPGHPVIQVRHWGPDTNIPIHRHIGHEMFYVLDGEVEIGDKVYKTGDCIFIPRGQLYGPTRAPKGAKILRYYEANRQGPQPPAAGSKAAPSATDGGD